MRNILILLGASYCFLACNNNFVQSSSPDSYLTGNNGIQKFSVVGENGALINYQFVPKSPVKRSYDEDRYDVHERVKRQSASVTLAPNLDPKSAGGVNNNNGKKATEQTVSKNVNNTTTNTTSTTNNNNVKGTGDSTTIKSTAGTNLSQPSNTNGSSNVVASSSTPPVASINNSTNNNNTEFDDNSDKLHPSYPLLPKSNETWVENNVTDTIQIIKNETHTYYNSSTILNGTVYWVDLENHPEAQFHEMLSSAHRRAATIKLKFPFPFYGHMIQNVTVATGGFIYLGEHVHAWLAATQYIAVLMANFDSSLSQNASVRYLSTDSQFTVEWHQVHLKDSPEKGPFTFQATMFKNGSIVFVYKLLSININAIDDHSHPVKVGLSDAYIRDKHVLFVKQKTIYEYDRIDLKAQEGANIGNGTAIVFTPLPNCLNYKTCYDCAHHQTKFTCAWCPYAKRCSDGTDRYRDDWLSKECEKDGNHIKNDDECLAPGTYVTNSTTPSATSSSHAASSSSSSNGKIDHVAKTPVPSEGGMSAFGVISVLFLVILIVSAVGWIFYAYVFPHSTSGQLLIRYRPSTWTFRRNSVRYSAASIHM